MPHGESISFLAAAPYVACGTTAHTLRLAFAVLGFLVYLIGIEVWFMYQLIKHRALVENLSAPAALGLGVSPSTSPTKRRSPAGFLRRLANARHVRDVSMQVR